jgi:hypothetical protein
MPGTSSAKTRFALLPGHDELRDEPLFHGGVFESGSQDGLFPARMVRCASTCWPKNDRGCWLYQIRASNQIDQIRIGATIEMSDTFTALRVWRPLTEPPG